MSVLQFVANLANSLAWPLATVVGLFLFRKPIGSLVSGTVGGRRLQRLKLGPAEAEWEKLDQAQHEAASSTDGERKPGADSQVTDPQLQEVLEFASKAPEAAVIKTSKNLEHELSELLREKGIQPRGGWSWTMAKAIQTAQSEELIGFQLASTLHNLRHLRNEVVHGTGEVTPARAALYVLTASDAIDQLKTIPLS
ncbi:hypothetical protein MOQ72_29085 [Saccharopolyspora sp. K220]|uniref:DUF4145 domain-containing protein n=1 Tax=Saccharopolyspora soli TaxID=2926618 RepID=UPI001F58A1CB|nr:DUF4145 domain-containing protein [Saccharopolyspora soli]MCI2421496.1 hypothetical protein [Saccharopolyspora soli]